MIQLQLRMESSIDISATAMLLPALRDPRTADRLLTSSRGL